MKNNYLIICFVMIMLVTTISAMDWDNVKDYDENTKTLTVTNTLGLGETLAQMQLITPENYKVSDEGEGIFQKIAEIRIKEYSENLDTAFGGIDIYDYYTKEKQDREVKIKYKILTYEEENIVELVCPKDYKNLYDCYHEIKGTKLVEKEQWIEFKDIKELPKEEINIGVFIDVIKGERGEWIPNKWFGEEIDEWASWQESMYNKILRVWDFSESGQAVLEQIDKRYTTISSPIFKDTNIGKIGYGLNISAGAGAGFNYLTNATVNYVPCQNFTIAVWYNGTNTDAGRRPIHGGYVTCGVADENGNAFCYDRGGTSQRSGSTSINNGEFHSIVYLSSGEINKLNIFIDGVLDLANASFDLDACTQNANVGGDSGEVLSNEFIDGLMIWNRTLTSEEIAIYHNGGAGNLYPGNAPIITLSAPANALESLKTTQTLMCNVTANIDNIGNLNTIKLYVDGVVDSTYVTTNNQYNLSKEVSGLSIGGHNWTCWANNTNQFSSIATNRTFNIISLQYGNEDYNNGTVESSLEVFKINVSLSTTKSISSAEMIYNGTRYNSTTTSLGSDEYDEYLLSNTITIPQVTADSNITFFWITTLTDGKQYNSTLRNQTVYNFAIDDCSVESLLILNYTLYDEDTKNIITVGQSNNATIEITLNLYSSIDSTKSLINYSSNFSTNYANICVGTNSLLNSTYYMDVITRYDAGDDYISEFNNIKDYRLTNATATQHIALYDLLVTRSQEFLIIFKDANFIRKADVIVDITRKYLDDGIYRTIEKPITDSNGETLAHFVLGDVIYTMTFKYKGEVLAVFDNFLARCDDATLGGCQINVNAFSSTLSVENFEYINGVSLIETIDDRTITAIFNTESGNKIVSLNVTKFDRFGNQTVCSDQLSTSSGTLSCTIPETFGNLTILSQVYSNGEIISQKTYSITESPTDMYGASIIIIVLLVFVTMTMLFIETPEGVLLGGFVGLVLCTLLSFLNLGSPFRAGASLSWILLGIIIVIWKLSHKEESR